MKMPADFPGDRFVMGDHADLDLGNEHWLRFFDSKGAEKSHAMLVHRCANSPTGWHEGSLAFDVPDSTATTKWKVNSWDPLDISPSVQQNCGCPLGHGFIRQGRYVTA